MSVSTCSGCCTALALLTATTGAQVAWTPRPAALTPPPRGEAVAAFDSGRGRLVVFGGYGSGMLGDHWEWDGTGWSQFNGLLPPPRQRAAMAYDRFTGSLVLFGGDTPWISDETWVFDGVAWAARNPAVRPRARFGHALAFDARRRRVVMFGGLSYLNNWPVLLTDTLEWDGSTWIQPLVIGGPQGRSEHAMAYDEGRGAVVLFGGAGTFPTRFNDTWEWNGTAWRLAWPPIAPPPSSEHAMAYDRARRRVVLYTGHATNGTWEWDGSVWMQRPTATAPPWRTRHTMAYDDVRNQTLMFAGQGQSTNHADLWEYGPVFPATITALGNGCPGTAGLPVLAAASGDLPWLGETLGLTVAPIPPAQPVSVWFGVSTTNWLGIPLPLDLGWFGMPGCTVYCSLDTTMPASSGAGMASLDVRLPVSTALLGAVVAAQSKVADAGANAIGVITTNAVRLRLGAK